MITVEASDVSRRQIESVRGTLIVLRNAFGDVVGIVEELGDGNTWLARPTDDDWQNRLDLLKLDGPTCRRLDVRPEDLNPSVRRIV